MRMPSMGEVEVRGRRVLVRVDLNLPVQDSVITDRTRLERVLPTITDLSDRGAKAIVMSHFGRPKGKPQPSMSLALIADAKTAIERSATLLWNGPLGTFATKPFDAATNQVARYAVEQTDQGKLLTIAGGGDTAAALSGAGVIDRFSYVSTAGGAFLEWLEGKELPGLTALAAAHR